jgi:plasmid stabilization system protein ParE
VILLAPEALEDLERIFEFETAHDETLAHDHLATIREAIMILDRHPLIGRPARPSATLRELVISQGRSGYVALYEYSPGENLVRVVAIRHQREAGYRTP